MGGAWLTISVENLNERSSDHGLASHNGSAFGDLVAQLSLAATAQRLDVSPEQIQAWEETFSIMGVMAQDLTSFRAETRSWSLLFEYPIPRRETRPDVVLLGSGFAVVIEMKVGADVFRRADRLQAEDYARDLKDFHEQSASLVVVPVLCATGASRSDVDLSDDRAESRVQLVAPDELAPLIEKIHERWGTDLPVSVDDWNHSRYRPTPSIIETALDVFSGQEVREITHAYADNLNATVEKIRALIHQARVQRQRIVCFVTGVPGSGKTLAGLSAVHEATDSGRPSSLGTYLSGNGPLVDVLQYALARDLKNREGLKMKEAKRRSSVMIQMVHRFMRELGTSSIAPPEHVIVFDEAQRAWDAQHMFSKQKISRSEAQITFDIMSRTEGWSVIVALVGEGQEINDGEAGISEWMDALEEFPDWQVYASPHVTHSLADRVTSLGELHLSVGVRAPRAHAMARWVDAVVSADAPAAAQALSENKHYPVYISRDLGQVRQYLRDRASSDRRVGLLASAQARRLRAFGIEMSTAFQKGVNWPIWFVDGQEDIRSSYSLEVAASEFKCQGLEIDWVGLCWGSDFTFDRQSGAWRCRRLSGSKWVDDKKVATTMNRYRVLLSRARYGLMIWVPEPSHEIPLVDSEAFNQTASFLEACGARPLTEID